jgi:hypothetical protein
LKQSAIEDLDLIDQAVEVVTSQPATDEKVG